MSEKVISTYPVGAPGGYEKLDAIEYIKTDKGSERLRGVITLAGVERRIQLPDIGEAWGYDAQEWQEYKANPKAWEQDQQMSALIQRIEVLEEKNALLEEQLRHSSTMANSQTNIVSAPETSGTTSLDTDTTTPPIATEVIRVEPENGSNDDLEHGDLLEVTNNDGSTESGWVAASGIWADKNEKEKITVTKNGQVRIFSLENVQIDKPVNDTVVEEPVDGVNSSTASKEVTSDSRLRRGWNRSAGRIGNLMLGYQVRAHNGAYNLVDQRGRVIRKEVEIVDGYPPESERAGAVAIGAIALAGLAGGVIGYLIGHKTGHTIRIPSGTETVTVPTSGGNSHQVIQGFSVPGPNSSGRHVDFYNSAPGHRLTAADLPKSAHFAGSPGHERLIDSSGHTIVPHSKLEWDRQGNLSRSTRAYLKSKNFVLTQGNLGRRFMTYVWQR